jgi:predicted cupin superfamily sugar epimerase
MTRAEQLIAALRLQPHPEGGYYRETYRSPELLTTPDGRTRHVCTAIYFLLTADDISHLHRIRSDETWLFHQGQAVELTLIAEGRLRSVLLGNDLTRGEAPQVTVPAGTWFGARLHGEAGAAADAAFGKADDAGYALVSCLVAPAFDFADFELATPRTFEEMPGLHIPHELILNTPS